MCSDLAACYVDSTGHPLLSAAQYHGRIFLANASSTTVSGFDSANCCVFANSLATLAFLSIWNILEASSDRIEAR